MYEIISRLETEMFGNACDRFKLTARPQFAAVDKGGETLGILDEPDRIPQDSLLPRDRRSQFPFNRVSFVTEQKW